LSCPHNTSFDLIPQEPTSNIFDNIPALAKPRLMRLRDELATYLTDPEYVKDVLTWWYKVINISTPVADGIGLFNNSWYVLSIVLPISNPLL